MIKFFRLAGLFEGISLLALLGVAMPLKYKFGLPQAAKVTGWFHGLFFMAYIGSLAFISTELSWSRKKTMVGFIAGILPLGTFFFDRHANNKKDLS